METVQVIIVGGGPGGSSCAWKLRQLGMSCMVLDRAAFPRLKLCGGWVTPEVIDDLQIDLNQYPHSLTTFREQVVHLWGLTLRFRSVQHSIRRTEFDAWLLERSGVPVIRHEVKKVQPDGAGFVLDDRFRCTYLVGAGGTSCPVYRGLFKQANPRSKVLQAATLEEEFPHAWQDGRCHLWFFPRRLPGYAWYVPKGNGYVNVGVGGSSAGLRARGDDLKRHWAHLTATLARRNLVPPRAYAPGGYSYYLRGRVEVPRLGQAFLVGDALGLATRDLSEGIGPAVRSGLLAAEAIARGADYSVAAINRYSAGGGLISKLLDRAFVQER